MYDSLAGSRTHIPIGKEVRIELIYDIGEAIANAHLPVLIKLVAEESVIASVLRLGTSRRVRIIFKGKSLLLHYYYYYS